MIFWSLLASKKIPVTEISKLFPPKSYIYCTANYLLEVNEKLDIGCHDIKTLFPYFNKEKDELLFNLIQF